MTRKYGNVQQYEREILEFKQQGLTHREIGEKFGKTSPANSPSSVKNTAHLPAGIVTLSRLGLISLSAFLAIG